jgi:Protein of unknown function (DUF3572)
MKLGTPLTQDAAEGLAIQALTFIAGEPERLGRFLAATGIGPAEIRGAAREPGFLAGVLEYLAGDERLLTAFSTDAAVDPANIGKALATLGGGAWERESP